MKRAITTFLMVFCLLDTQQAAYAHELSHTDHGSPAGHDKSLPHTKICSQCALSAQLGTGLLGSPALVLPVSAITPSFAAQAAIVYPVPPRRFQSRAPPTAF